ncbi:MAG TPA: aminotransferase class I/II-fold pyridoxal phosphate-dependent enzyme [Thermoanaerobaculaceae bacterium]|nr:aminotransferase class I/II-fold pyridoxal phosphate-dependent enzyme [Thermoanaerobaculaceae bacterium]
MPRLAAVLESLHFGYEPAQVARAAATREAEGQRVLHLERDETDFPTPPHVLEALTAALQAGETHYPPPGGVLPLRVALVEKLDRENGISCHPEDVVVTAGATHGLGMAVRALLAPDDEILVLTPYWPTVPGVLGLVEGVRWRGVSAYLDVLEDALAPEALAARLRANLRPWTRALHLNTPNNPTGAVLSREHLAAVAAVACEHDLWVLSDETYEHLVFDDAEHVSIAALPGMANRTVSLFSFSVSYAMPGWRLGYVVSPPALRPALGPELAALTTRGVFPAVQLAGLAALTGPQRVIETTRQACCERRDLFLAQLAGQSVLRAARPSGTFYAFVDVAAALERRTVWDLVREWLELGIAVLPGTAFGPYPERVRFSLATRRDDVGEATRRLRERYAGTPAG